MQPVQSEALPPPVGRVGRRLLLGGSTALFAAPFAARAQGVAPGGGSAPPAPGAAAGQSAVIDVNRARTDPIPIAIPDLGGDQLGRQISGVITDDLARCGLFRPLDPQSFIQAGIASSSQSDASGGDVPNFQNWRVIGAQALVTGHVENQGGDRMRVEFRLWDVLPAQQIQGTAYTTSSGNWRRVAHIMADVIYERLLGEKGYFDTRIVYVAGTGPRDRRTRRLAIMDQDGENTRYLTDGGWMVLTPRFHPTRDEIAFMSYANNRPRVYTFDLGTGRQQVLGEFEGMTLSPRFNPDGSSIIMAETRGAGSDIVVVELGSRRGHKLTSSGSIDVSPCYSPDGSQIVFNSDRGGNQQLYIMGADGSGAHRISYGKGEYATPVWSPRGDLIAFTRLGSTFAIGVMHPDGSGERILSESFDVEGPTFAPNGRVIMFWRESPARDSRGNGYSARLVSIDITGFNERMLQTPTDASDPAWSPLAT
jgi:TolB protein